LAPSREGAFHRSVGPRDDSRRAALETSTSPILFFEVDKMLEELTGAKAALLSKGDEIVEVFGDVAQAECGQAAGQFTHGRLRVCVRACRKGQARAA
jgi:hypothetical protein